MQKDCRNNPCQRYGSALNLNVHLHILVPDGAYTFEHDKPHFHRAPAPSPTELHELLNTLIARITRTLVRGGLLDQHPATHQGVEQLAQLGGRRRRCAVEVGLVVLEGIGAVKDEHV